MRRTKETETRQAFPQPAANRHGALWYPVVWVALAALVGSGCRFHEEGPEGDEDGAMMGPSTRWDDGEWDEDRPRGGRRGHGHGQGPDGQCESYVTERGDVVTICHGDEGGPEGDCEYYGEGDEQWAECTSPDPGDPCEVYEDDEGQMITECWGDEEPQEGECTTFQDGDVIVIECIDDEGGVCITVIEEGQVYTECFGPEEDANPWPEECVVLEEYVDGVVLECRGEDGEVCIIFDRGDEEPLMECWYEDGDQGEEPCEDPEGECGDEEEQPDEPGPCDGL